MSDERGRGGKLHPRLENAALQGLCRAILEQAITDRVCLDDLGEPYAKVNNGHISIAEIKRFEKSRWKSWLESQLTLTSVDAVDAIKRGHRMARNSVANKCGKSSGRGAYKRNIKYLYEYEGEMLTYWEIAKRANLTAGEVQNRLQQGIPAEDVVKQARERRAAKGLPIRTAKIR